MLTGNYVIPVLFSNMIAFSYQNDNLNTLFHFYFLFILSGKNQLITEKCVKFNTVKKSHV